MLSSAVSHREIVPSAVSSLVLSSLEVDECHSDSSRIAIPRAEIQLVVRFGPSAVRGLDVHLLGSRMTAHRKLIRAGQRAVIARLRLGAHQAVLGVSAAALTGRIVALEDLWGPTSTRALIDSLAAAPSSLEAGRALDLGIARRVSRVSTPTPSTSLALAAAEKLPVAPVSLVADQLGVSERHLRRIFHESFGISPKRFAKLSRFHRALGAATEAREIHWASIAASAGYYDQAHLIAEFRGIAGVTPQALLRELRDAPSTLSTGTHAQGTAQNGPSKLTEAQGLNAHTLSTQL